MRYAAYLIALIFIIGLAIPVSAQTSTITAPTGQAIWSISMVAQPNTIGTFTISLYDGNSYSGSFDYHTNVVVDLNGASSTANYPISGLFNPLYMKIWNGDNTTYARKIKYGYGQVNGFWTDYVETDISISPIESFTLNSDQEVTITPEYVSTEDAMKQLQAEKEESILELGYALLSDALSFGYNLFGWVKFFFITGLSLVVAVYLAVSMAFAARASRGNPGRFFRVFISDMKKLFTFIMEVWRWLIEAVATILSWFKVV